MTSMIDAYVAKAKLEPLVDGVVLVDQELGKWVLKVYGATDAERIDGIEVRVMNAQHVDNRSVDEAEDSDRDARLISLVSSPDPDTE